LDISGPVVAAVWVSYLNHSGNALIALGLCLSGPDLLGRLKNLTRPACHDFALLLVRLDGNVGGCANANLSALNYRLKLRSAAFADFLCSLNTALSHIKKFGSPRLGGFANWRMLIIAALKRSQLGCDHGPLTLIQMSPLEIAADDKTDRIVAGIGN
jgi:hypothetical protein